MYVARASLQKPVSEGGCHTLSVFPKGTVGAEQCKGFEKSPPGTSVQKQETRCTLAMKTSATRSSWDVPPGLHGNHMQLKPCSLFAKPGRPSSGASHGTLPWLSDCGSLSSS